MLSRKALYRLSAFQVLNLVTSKFPSHGASVWLSPSPNVSRATLETFRICATAGGSGLASEICCRGRASVSCHIQNQPARPKLSSLRSA